MNDDTPKVLPPLEVPDPKPDYSDPKDEVQYWTFYESDLSIRRMDRNQYFNALGKKRWAMLPPVRIERPSWEDCDILYYFYRLAEWK